MSVHIRKVAELLKEEGVEIEAQLLFTANGRKKLRPQLLGIPQMYLSKGHSGRLRGVVMADILTLPEKVKIERDTVIIARRVNFTGRAPTIKGPHDLHLFALDSANVSNSRETVVTIDTSGFGRKEWLESLNQRASNSKQTKTVSHHANLLQDTSGTHGTDGLMGGVGSNGNSGVTGQAGVQGSCSTGGGGGGDTSGYEPGALQEHCTPWYWVSFHCEYYLDRMLPNKKRQHWANHARSKMPFAGWQCVETGRSYIGCF